jgi:hypothetical protein
MSVFVLGLPFRLTAMVSNWRQRVYLLHKLIMSVTVETLTQVTHELVTLRFLKTRKKFSSQFSRVFITFYRRMLVV